MRTISRLVLVQSGAFALAVLSMCGCFGSAHTQPKVGLGDNRPATPTSATPASGLNSLGTNASSVVVAKPSPEDVPRLAQAQADILNRLIAEGVIKPDAIINRDAAAAKAPPNSPTTIYNNTGSAGSRPSPAAQPAPNVRSLPPAPAPTPTPAPVVPSAGLSSLTGETPSAASGTAQQPVSSAVEAAPRTVEDRINFSADELAKSLRERMATSRDPVNEFITLAWLDSIRPGVLGSLESGPAARLLDPQQSKSVAATRDIAAALARTPDVLGNPDKMWKTVTKAAEPIVAARDIRVATAELCTKVDGFGQYAPVTNHALLAGSSHRLVVYTEVEGFADRKIVDPDGTQRSVVEIAQAIEIWQDADRPTLQKRWNESALKDTSRRVRRDFFLTTVIDLPQTLSVGSYNLKIIVKDVVHNSIAEHIIPFRMVADANLAAAIR